MFNMRPLAKGSDRRREWFNLWKWLMKKLGIKATKYIGKSRKVYQLFNELLNTKEKIYMSKAPLSWSTITVKKLFFETNLDNDLSSREMTIVTKMHIIFARFILTDWDVDFDDLLEVMKAFRYSLQDKNYIFNEQGNSGLVSINGLNQELTKIAEKSKFQEPWWLPFTSFNGRGRKTEK